MDCQNEEIVTRLPLYAAGTLDQDGCARVEAHLGTCSSCRAELDTLKDMADACKIYGSDLSYGHIMSEQLVAYSSQRTRLDKEARESVEGHLKICYWCSRELDLLNEMNNELALSERASDTAPRRAALFSYFKETFAGRHRPLFQSAWAAMVILTAAALLITLYFVPREKRDVPRVKSAVNPEPHPSPEKELPPMAQTLAPRFTLQRETLVRGRAAAVQANRIEFAPSHTDFFVSFFIAITSEPGVQYNLQIADSQGRLILQRPDIKSKDAFGNFEEKFPRARFSPGHYVLTVTEVRRENGQIIKAYHFPFEALLK